MALTDRFRGTRGFFGWLILKWDVYQIRRMVSMDRASLYPRGWPPLTRPLMPPPKTSVRMIDVQSPSSIYLGHQWQPTSIKLIPNHWRTPMSKPPVGNDDTEWTAVVEVDVRLRFDV